MTHASGDSACSDHDLPLPDSRASYFLAIIEHGSSRMPNRTQNRRRRYRT